MCLTESIETRNFLNELLFFCLMVYDICAIYIYVQKRSYRESDWWKEE